MKLTDAEWQIMNALWESHPSTARQVLELLPADVRWAYTTVKTMLARLADKGVVTEQKQGNVSYYEPVLSREKARRSALKTLAEQAFAGAFGPLMHFLVEDQKLTAKQRAELLKALEEEDKRKGAGK